MSKISYYMYLVDVESGEKLISPYIQIEGFTQGIHIGTAMINTNTFGQMGQEELIEPLEDIDAYEKDLYHIWAVAGNYNFPNKDVGLNLPPKSKTFIGYLERSIIEGCFPKTHDRFEVMRKKIS